MTSEERHEIRYQRRKAERDRKREEKVREGLHFETVFTFRHLYHSALRCFRGVSWKASVQAYKARCGINVARKLKALREGTYVMRKSPEFKTRERGHERRINSIHIDDRVPEKCNSMYSLKTVLHRSLIYDNYASQDNKGTDKARNRLKCMLERHIRKHGMSGGMIIFDFRRYFDSIPHCLINSILNDNYEDQRIINMNMRIVRKNRSNVGLVLGSENSQDFAISVLNRIDHYIKENLNAEGYGRYMDDGWIIHHDFEELKIIFEKIKELAEQFGFTLNEKKCQIIHFGRQFTMLKRKYSFTETGAIIIRPARESVIRERRKLKRLYRRFLQGTMRVSAGYDSVNAWKSSLRGCRCYKITKSIENLYNSMYIQNWLCGMEG